MVGGPLSVVVVSGIADSENPPPSDEPAPPPAPAPAFPLPWPPLLGGQIGLRPWGSDGGDPDVLTAAWNDEGIARWTQVPPQHDREAAAHWIAGEGTRRGSGKAVDLVIIEAGQPQRVLGEVGMVLVDPDRRWAEIGYWLIEEARGEGRATAAVRMFSAWALKDLGINRLFARTNGANPASGKVAQRAGYDLAGTLDDGVQVWVLDAGA